MCKSLLFEQLTYLSFLLEWSRGTNQASDRILFVFLGEKKKERKKEREEERRGEERRGEERRGEKRREEKRREEKRREEKRREEKRREVEAVHENMELEGGRE